MNSPNITLKLLCGLDGIIYANTSDRTKSSDGFLPDGQPPYNYGKHIIMDNAPIHHNRAGEALGEWLDDISCTLTIQKRFEFRERLPDNLHDTVYEALKTTTREDMSGFFRFTGYINLDNMNILFLALTRL
ncbi:hypothetical protein P5673_026462 [Acropora cervicornis]|uniref:Uncharacterized protein n=1 Tax=Acropora cervicornis TaxID=6130 RepID=A0AAD9Q081_ACRCE|nr:hypothetical protein P5673_026462 [Acropora cervicornis]